MVLLCLIGLSSQAEITQLLKLWWTNGTYGHGLLVVPVSLYLIWLARHRLAGLPIEPSGWSLLLVALFSIVSYVAKITDVLVVSQLCIVLLGMSVVWTVLGHRVARVLAFPLAYLVMAVPVWAVLIPPLRDVTAIVSAGVVRALSVPVYVEGNFIQIPGGTFEIADVCAGLRFFLAGLSLALLYAYLSFNSWRRAALFVVLAVVWVIVFNWVRVVTVIMIGHLGGMDHPLVVDHYSIGWVLFAVAMVPLLLAGGWLQKGDTRNEAVTADHGSDCVDVAPGVSTVTKSILCGVLILGAPVLAKMAEPENPNLASLHLLSLPDSVAGWHKVGDGNSIGSRFMGADVETSARYTKDKRFIDVYVAAYSHQRQGAEVINQQNRVYDKHRWRSLSRGAVLIANSSTGPATVQEIILSQGVTDTVVMARYWYLIAGYTAENRLWAKGLQIVGALRGRHQALAIVISTTAGEQDRERETLMMDEFSESITPILAAASSRENEVPTSE